MADAAPKTQIKQLYNSEHANTSKFFLYKAALVTVFLVLLPLFPSMAPDFFNQTLHARSWELLQIIFVGIAVSYGLFSKRNIDEPHKDNNNNNSYNPCSKIDNAQSYVSKLLQVSSVFDDESENHTAIEENKFQALNSQYSRGEPVVVVAKENPSDEETNGVVSKISQKPLLLPVRSLKQRVVPVTDEVDRSERVNSKKLGSTSSRKSRFVGVVGGLNIANKMEEGEEEKEEEDVVLCSPIPWRSRSGRMEVKEKENGDEQTPLISSSSSSSCSKEEQESNKRMDSSRSFRSGRANGSSKNLSPSTSFSSQSQSKGGGEELVRKKKFSSPPPAPPPPPSPALLRKSSSSVGSGTGSVEKVLRRSVRSVPMEELIENKSAAEFRVGRTFRPNELEMKGEKESEDFVEINDEEEESEDDDQFDDSLVGSSSGGGGDVGPDVDKKADEFIAKFREQIRLQRIESIRRTTAQRAGKSLRLNHITYYTTYGL